MSLTFDYGSLASSGTNKSGKLIRCKDCEKAYRKALHELDQNFAKYCKGLPQHTQIDEHKPMAISGHIRKRQEKVNHTPFETRFLFSKSKFNKRPVSKDEMKIRANEFLQSISCPRCRHILPDRRNKKAVEVNHYCEDCSKIREGIERRFTRALKNASNMSNKELKRLRMTYQYELDTAHCENCATSLRLVAVPKSPFKSVPDRIKVRKRKKNGKLTKSRYTEESARDYKNALTKAKRKPKVERERAVVTRTRVKTSRVSEARKAEANAREVAKNYFADLLVFKYCTPYGSGIVKALNEVEAKRKICHNQGLTTFPQDSILAPA